MIGYYKFFYLLKYSFFAGKMFNQCQDNQANDNISYLCGIRRFTSILIGLVFLMFVLQIILWYFESKIAYSYTKLLIN
ncbi:Hypothetical protein ERGA_CDS_04150 [Ehrlichia ruminantium str. Gardel]|nr:Hypothetical protein ERGA_CDS_04150 [Ehrlichia ruminantium str. Gardel]